jgi:hypothetical protein
MTKEKFHKALVELQRELDVLTLKELVTDKTIFEELEIARITINDFISILRPRKRALLLNEEKRWGLEENEAVAKT